MTAAGRMRPAAVAASTLVLAAVFLGLLPAGPAQAHSEGLTPYRYVAAPPGVRSEGPPETGVSTQKLGRAGFAGTTDNQMQLTLPPDVLPPRTDERGVRVTLEQLDPSDLPRLPAGLEPEGNGYRVSMIYAASRKSLKRLAGPATLGLSAPAAPTALYELLDGAWKSRRYTPVTADEGFTSVVELTRPGTFLQAYDPASARPATATGEAAPATGSPPARSGPTPTPVLAALVGAALLLATAFLVVRRRRARSPREGSRS